MCRVPYSLAFSSSYRERNSTMRSAHHHRKRAQINKSNVLVRQRQCGLVSRQLRRTLMALSEPARSVLQWTTRLNSRFRSGALCRGATHTQTYARTWTDVCVCVHVVYRRRAIKTRFHFPPSLLCHISLVLLLFFAFTLALWYDWTTARGTLLSTLLLQQGFPYSSWARHYSAANSCESCSMILRHSSKIRHKRTIRAVQRNINALFGL